jgi:hypothetical protein
MSEERSVVGWARARMRDDHEQLHKVLLRLREESERTVLAALLRELPQRLADHFRREEEPGGLYDAMGVSLPEARGDVGRLVDDHFRLVSMARNLAEEALSPGVTTSALREQAARVASYLDDHEQREHDLARAAAERD